ncbi:hypothetical protein JYK02_05415 [Corallococcus macrosporus]|uniref:Peptidoglycan-binding protein n=1 Tax=Corallococcus macrosporus TaxID=35 RepID=A0ABS3D7M2_9BACT|nr:hypothetical protein [Corallococcus macrosporus]MBN8226947.1 hypothetical protein [Corallococcus macrosporus]
MSFRPPKPPSPKPPDTNLKKTVQRELTPSLSKKAPSSSDLRTEAAAHGLNRPKPPDANLEKAIQRELPPSLAKKTPSINDIRAGEATLRFNFKGEASAYVGQLLDPKNAPKAPTKLVGSLLRFQRKNGLRANGFVDALTLKALEEKAPKPGGAPMKGSEKSAQDGIKGAGNLKGATSKENVSKVNALLETIDPEALKSIIDALQKAKKAVKPPR